MSRKLAVVVMVVGFLFATVMGVTFKRVEVVSGTIVDTVVTAKHDTSSYTGSIVDVSGYRVYDMFVVLVKADSFVPISVADTTHLNDSIGAKACLYATQNGYNLLLDSQTISLPGTVMLDYGDHSKLYPGCFIDSLRIDVIEVDSILTTNDSATFTWTYQIQKIEVQDFIGDDNR